MKNVLLSIFLLSISLVSFAEILPIKNGKLENLSYGYCHGMIKKMEYSTSKDNKKILKILFVDPKMPLLGKSNCDSLVITDIDLKNFKSNLLGTHFLAKRFEFISLKDLKVKVKAKTRFDNCLEDCEITEFNVISEYEIKEINKSERNFKNKRLNSLFNDDENDEDCESI